MALRSPVAGNLYDRASDGRWERDVVQLDLGALIITAREPNVALDLYREPGTPVLGVAEWHRAT